MSEPRDWQDPAQAGGGYPPNTDPAYAEYWSPPYYGQGYSNPEGTPITQPTQQMPAYWQPGMGYPPGPPPPPQPPKSPRWLWVAAGAAVLLVTGLVLALVVVSSSPRESTIVAPPTAPTTSPTSPRLTLPPMPPTTRVPLPTATARPQPTTPGAPPVPGPPPGIPEQVVYRVTGDGRAINITYVDTDGVMQTEFNVALPWSREVTLASPAKNSASVAVVNVGRDVTCTVSVNGTQVRQRSGRGLTICSGAG